MKKKLGILCMLIVMLLSLVPAHVSAKPESYFYPKSYNDYVGNIGGYKITLSLYYNEGTLKGTYIYNKYRKEIEIDGKIDDKDKVTLNEYDTKHRITATFSGKLDREEGAITGIWKNVQKTKKFKFSIRTTHGLAGVEYGHKYVIGGFENDRDCVKAVEQIQKYIKKNDAVRLSKLVMYPVNVVINNKTVEIKNRKQFVKNYKRIFTAEFKETILQADAPYLFANYQGVMICPTDGGMSNMWIYNIDEGEDSHVSIIAINN